MRQLVNALLAAVLMGGLATSAIPPTPAVTAVLQSPSPAPAATGTPGPTASVSVPARTTIAGVASWYCLRGVSPCTARHAASGAYAAAGPALRAALGDWRGRTVTVNGVPVQLVDWCECYRGTDHERLLDLYGSVFTELAPLSRGLVAVKVTW